MPSHTPHGRGELPTSRPFPAPGQRAHGGAAGSPAGPGPALSQRQSSRPVPSPRRHAARPAPRRSPRPAAAMTAAARSPSAAIRPPSTASCRPGAPGPVSSSPGRPYTFFLAPFLPPLVRRLFLPTAMVPTCRRKGRKRPLARDYTRAELARELRAEGSALARAEPHLAGRGRAARPLGRTTAGRNQRRGGKGGG